MTLRMSINDLSRKMRDEVPPRRTNWKRLRGAMWLAYALEKSELDVEEFAAKYVHRGRSKSNLLWKWRAGSAAPTRHSVQAVERLLPGTKRIFELPLFPLLDDRPLPLRRIQKLIAKYRKSQWLGFCWQFPDFPETSASYGLLAEDTYGLLQRTDLCGVLGILALVREAEAIGDVAQHAYLCRDLCRALVRLNRIQWINSSMPLFRSCVDVIRNRVWWTSSQFDVDWSLVDNADDPVRSVDPILEAELVSGIEVRRRRLMREEKAARRRIKKLLLTPCQE